MTEASLVLNDTQIVMWYLQRGTNPNAQCGLGTTPFSVAIEDHPLATIELLHDHGADTAIGNPLHHAVMRKRDRVEAIEWLLAHGAKVN